MINVAINGLGRIGRVTLRQMMLDEEINVVAVNDLVDANVAAHLIKFDSVYGPFEKQVVASDGSIKIGDHSIKYFQEREPKNTPWGELKIDVLVDCTGIYKKYEEAHKHIESGAKKVVLSYPVGDKKIKSIVLGVNENEISNKNLIYSNASCTTNCASPILKVINNNWGIKKGFLNTIHAFTADQRVNDSAHSDMRRARAASVNIIPTSTGAAKAISLVIPELEGRIDGSAYRVPVITGSCIDVLLELDKDFTAEDVNEAIKRVSNSEMKGVVKYSADDLVSTDIVGDKHSSIFDSKLTQKTNGSLKIVSWYDNEFGYSNRLVDLCKMI